MRFAEALLRALPPETAHRAAISALSRYTPFPPAPPDSRLAVEAFGLRFAHPLGLAAGFDKSAEAFASLGKLGFGFVEVGTLTPQPQAGNPKPRLFRLAADRAIINRMGFNNDGFASALARLSQRARDGILGVNVGPNKDSADRIADFAAGVETFAACADYLTLNVSSPNTPGLRNMQAAGDLAALLAAARAARDRARSRAPLLVKLAPDISEEDLPGILDAAMAHGADGVIISNTTISRPPGLQSRDAVETGGLSGRPLRRLSTRMLAKARLHCGARLPLVGAGGVEDAESALEKIEAGATLVQVYTGFIYRGAGLIGEIARGLARELDKRGAANLSALVGARAEELSADQGDARRF